MKDVIIITDSLIATKNMCILCTESMKRSENREVVSACQSTFFTSEITNRISTKYLT
jgi:hypothetical protein